MYRRLTLPLSHTYLEYLVQTKKQTRLRFKWRSRQLSEEKGLVSHVVVQRGTVRTFNCRYINGMLFCKSVTSTTN